MTAGGRIKICFVTDRNATGGRPLVEIVGAAVAGGVDMVQVREKDLGGAELLRLVREIQDAIKRARARCPVIVNDRLDVALAAKSAGVHLPGEGLPVELVRKQVKDKFLIGRSVHALAEGRDAAKAGASYLFFGPVFATPSKAAYGEPQGPAALAKAGESLRAPVWAIGGITPESAAELRGLPIAGVAAIGAIASAPDPAEAVRGLRAALAGDDPAS